MPKSQLRKAALPDNPTKDEPMNSDLRIYHLQDWGELFPTIRRAREVLGGGPVWYRGHTNPHFLLVPSLFRGGISDPAATAAERTAFESFERLAPRFGLAQKRDWHTLVDMQHYGLPTRLLDWTSVLGLAVFFATSRYRPSRDDEAEFSLYLLNPARLNAKGGRAEIYSSENDFFSYKLIYWEHKPFVPTHPIALETPFVNERIYAQRGLFTVHSDEMPLDESSTSALCKIVLSPLCTRAAREFLDHANINEVTVFPDVQGLVAYVRSQMFLR